MTTLALGMGSISKSARMDDPKSMLLASSLDFMFCFAGYSQVLPALGLNPNSRPFGRDSSTILEHATALSLPARRSLEKMQDRLALVAVLSRFKARLA